MIEKAWQRVRANRPPGDWRIAHAESVKGALLARQGHRASAEQLLIDAHEALSKSLGRSHHHSQGARLRLTEHCRDAEREHSRLESICDAMGPFPGRPR